MRNNNRVTVGLWDYNLRLQRNESGRGGEPWEQSVLYSLPGCDGDALSAGCFVLVWGELCSTTWFDLVMRHWWVWGEIGQRSTNALQNCNVKYAVSSLSAADKKREWSERKKRRGQGERYSCQVHMPVAARLSWRTWIRRLKGVDWHRCQR